MKRGEIWTIAGGPDYSGKPRPAVIVQDDRFDAMGSVTICAFTSQPIDAPLVRIPVRPDDRNVLRSPSRLMVDKLTTIPVSKLGDRIGVLGPQDMVSLDRALLVFLGLAGPPPAAAEG